MSILSKVFSVGASEIIGEVGNIIDSMHTSTEEKQLAKNAAEKLVYEHNAKLLDAASREVEAKERVLVAELGQADNFTKRARPSVVYFGMFVIFLNYCFVPAIKSLNGSEPSPIILPEEFWWAWSGVVGTWVLGRTFERINGNNKATKIITG